jgi:hypothetical protein
LYAKIEDEPKIIKPLSINLETSGEALMTFSFGVVPKMGDTEKNLDIN